MTLTTIPIHKDTRKKLKEFAKKSETWNDLLNRLHENAVGVNAANIFFNNDSISIEDALKAIEKW